MKRALLILAGWQLAHDARVLMLAACFRRLPLELRDGHAARLAVEMAVAQDGRR